MESSEITVVEDQGLYANTCGYCKSQGPTSFAYGLRAYSLSPYDYQELLDQTWRRSGIFLYRPEPEKSCCPAYTIRLKADSIKSCAEHVRVMRRMKRYLDGVYTGYSSKGDLELARKAEGNDMSTVIGLAKPLSNDGRVNKVKQKLAGKDYIADMLTTKVHHAIKDCILHGELPDNFELSKITVLRFQKNLSRRGRKLLEGEVAYTCSSAFPCAVALLRQKKDIKIAGSMFSLCKAANKMEEKAILHEVTTLLADIVAFRLQTSSKIDSFKVQACKGHLNFIPVHSEIFITKNLYDTSNSTDGIINGKLEESTEKPTLTNASQSVQLNSAVNRHTLEIRTNHSVFDPEEFTLYRRYQIAIHGEKPEDVTEVTFRRFLVDTPLTFVPPPQDSGDFWGFGSFHQQYLIDGRLVAVGVIDILPSCLSSNYFFWDPDFAFLSLGRYSALKEIQWVQEAKRYCQTLEYYYLGHYIHSCPKMHYKVSFQPSELLCPFRFQWVPFELARPLLDKQPFVCLSDSLQAAQNLSSEQDNAGMGADNDASSMIAREERNKQGLERTMEMQSSYAVNYIVDEDELNSVLLRFYDNYIRFKELREWLVSSVELLDEVISKLEKYVELVGRSLASRMAYVLI